MGDTREKILTTALRLFAQDGYEAVSVSAIAGMLGMTKGALYRHYQSKREIFDRIVERMIQIDLACAKAHQVPEETFEQSPLAYRTATPDHLKGFTLAQFRFWTEDEFGRNFRRMVTLEQYRNPEMADWYHKVFADGPVQYLADLFREMIAQGRLKDGDPGRLAVDFYAPFYLLLAMSDAPSAEARAIDRLTAHIDHFIAINTATPSKDKES